MILRREIIALCAEEQARSRNTAYRLMFRNQYGWLLDLALSFAFLDACFNVGLTLPAFHLPCFCRSGRTHLESTGSTSSSRVRYGSCEARWRGHRL